MRFRLHIGSVMGSAARLLIFPLLSLCAPAIAQSSGAAEASEVEQLRATVQALQRRVETLERQQNHTANEITTDNGQGAAELAEAAHDLHSGEAAQSPSTTVSASKQVIPALPSQLPGGATLNYAFDGYYEYNFNHPVGRVNYLRAYDVLSNSFSVQQADIIFALDPDVSANRRYGVRLDLQFGQATDTLQGSRSNEPRPEIYQNIFQAYGTYIFPVGKGLQVDFGKWASSLGIEGNYTKDQMNYTRSFYFNFLPFYHAGIRANYKLNDKVAVNYWIVNGTDQTEPTNSFKDELFGIVVQPAKQVSWTINYYLGQDHPDATQGTSCAPAPVQTGLCLIPISPAPDGKIHIFDSYATWTATPKWTLAAEADYAIEREWANAAPGESSAPAHVAGGAAYAQYQLNPRLSFAARGEYLADPRGLFSNISQTLKEGTATAKYLVASNFYTFFEYRRDWSNQNYFLTNKPGLLSGQQPTTTVGVVWWYGGKQGPW